MRGFAGWTAAVLLLVVSNAVVIIKYITKGERLGIHPDLAQPCFPLGMGVFLFGAMDVVLIGLGLWCVNRWWESRKELRQRQRGSQT